MVKNQENKGLDPMSLLYIEEDHNRRLHYTHILKSLCSRVHIGVKRDEAFRLYEKLCPKLLIMEIDDEEGISILKKIREHDQSLRIIILSQHSDTKYLLEAIELDISRYLIQPVSREQLKEALEKVKSEVEEGNASKSIYLDNALFYQADLQSLVYEGKTVALNKKEARLLELLLEYKNKFITYSHIQKHIWPNTTASSSSLRTLVKNLRKKGMSELIKNSSGTGYMLSIS